MKKMMIALLMLCLLFSLTACGGSGEPAEEAVPTEAPAEEAPVEEAPAEEPAEAPEEPAAEPTAQEQAESCVGKDVQDLFALIGEPNSADYAPSCLGEGEDGILEYDGFQVYTYKEGDSERVDTVLAK